MTRKGGSRSPKEVSGGDDLVVPSDMLLEVTSLSPWTAMITWAPDGQPSSLSVRLREIQSGKIQIDYGSRTKGGRRSTGTKERQEAVWFADEKLRQIVKRRVDKARPELDRRLEDASGNPTTQDCFDLWLKRKRGHVTQKWHNHVRRVRDVLLAMYGDQDTPFDWDEERVQEFVRRRTSEWIRFGGRRQDLDPRKCSRGTAVKQLWMVFTVFDFAARTARPGNNREMVLAHNPLRSSSVRMPEKERGAGKRPLVLTHFRALTEAPRAPDGSVLLPPVDRIEEDTSGITRIVTALLFCQHRRRRAVTHLRRVNIAVTSEEVRRMLERLVRGKVPFGVALEWAEHFTHGLVEWVPEWDKEGCRQDQDPRDWWRVWPMSALVREEFDYYNARSGCYGFKPEQWLFPDTHDRSRPIQATVLFRAPQYRTAARNGTRTYDSLGDPVEVEQGERLHDEHGNAIRRNRGGWFRRAQEHVRADAIAHGLDPDKVMPLFEGEMVHGTRAGWIKTVEEHRWLGPSADPQLESEVNRHVRYLEGRVMPSSSRGRHYMPLNPILLQGIADFADRDEVMRDWEDKAIRDTSEIMKAVSESRLPVAVLQELRGHQDNELERGDAQARRTG